MHADSSLLCLPWITIALVGLTEAELCGFVLCWFLRFLCGHAARFWPRKIRANILAQYIVFRYI